MSQSSAHYLVDTHCHPNFKEYSGDSAGVILRARGAGVKKLIAVGTSTGENNHVIELAREHEGVWASVGYHPIYLDEINFEKSEDEQILDEIRKQLNRPKVVAVGEIGLDYFHSTDKSNQRSFFLKMLKEAKTADKPIIVHCRDAFSDCLADLESISGEWRGVMHCFTGGLKIANKVMDLGLHVGFTGLITYTRDVALLDAVENVPLETILIETDAPYLTPEPKRGEINEPANVGLVAKKIAEIKKIDYDEVVRVTTENAERLFGLV